MSVLTLGETMGRLSPPGIGPLHLQRSLDLSIAGAESTVAIGLQRLGHRTTFVTRLGDDELGRLVRSTLLAEGVQVAAGTDPDAPTGLLLNERRTADVRRVQYLRAGSAASLLSPDDVAEIDWETVELVHLTGITPALSATARDCFEAALAQATERGVPVSLDVNYRSRLWTRAEARAVLASAARSCAVVFASTDELDLLTVDAADQLLGGAVREVVVTDGARGSVAWTREGRTSAPARAVTAVDTTGAGDAFVAGYLSARLDGADVAGRLARGSAVAAFGVGTQGDWEGLPRRAELALLEADDGHVAR